MRGRRRSRLAAAVIVIIIFARAVRRPGHVHPTHRVRFGGAPFRDGARFRLRFRHEHLLLSVNADNFRGRSFNHLKRIGGRHPGRARAQTRARGFRAPEIPDRIARQRARADFAPRYPGRARALRRSRAGRRRSAARGIGQRSFADSSAVVFRRRRRRVIARGSRRGVRERGGVLLRAEEEEEDEEKKFVHVLSARKVRVVAVSFARCEGNALVTNGDVLCVVCARGRVSSSSLGLDEEKLEEDAVVIFCWPLWSSSSSGQRFFFQNVFCVGEEEEDER